MNKIIRNSSLLLGSEVLSRLGAFAINIWITRFLGVADYGKLAFAISFGVLFANLADLGFNVYTIREVSKNKDLAGKYISNMGLMRFVLSVIAWSLIVIMINVLGYPLETRTIVYLIGASTVINIFSDSFSTVFYAFEKMEYSAVLMMFQRLAPLVAGLFALLTGRGLIGLSFAYFIVSIISITLIITILSINFFVPKLEFDPKFCWKVMKELFLFNLAAIFSIVYFRIGVVMLSKMQGDSVVGWFSAAFKLIESLRFIPISMMGALLPVFSQLFVTNPKKLLADSHRALEVLLVIILPIMIGVLILGDKIIIFLYKDAFSNSIPVFRILIVAEVFMFVNYILTNLIVVCDKQKYNTLINFICCIACVVLNYLLIPKYSYLAVSFTHLAMEIFIFILCMYFLSGCLGTINIFKISAKPALAGLIMGAAVYFVRDLSLFVTVPGGSAVYLAALYLVGGFNFKGKFPWIQS
ncbi:MAG: hypothetical protein A2297_08550 [Elusimicrobia bacterium RIFOXYB2_FULL_48_7]|nr:MAG: hypothetical protein A2297_08550 [Elusimicrobia bacterium RIFOXYB2_FULL_48_7]